MNKSKKILISVLGVVSIILILLIVFSICNLNQEVSTTFTDVEVEENVEEPISEYIVTECIEDLENEENEKEHNIEVQNTVENTMKSVQTSNTTNNQTPYYIKINYGAQVVTIYGKDEQGNYTIPIKAMVCSTGTYTPKSGVYSIPARWKWLGLQGNVYGQYCTQINGNILFHSVPYLRKGDTASLEYWEYDKLGTYASAGCIRLTVKDAKWIYDNCAKGTKVEFYSSSDAGPLGRPSAKKISSYPDNLRNWDPTDPSIDNPWLNYNEQITQKPTNNQTTNTSTNTTTDTSTNTITDIVNDTTTNTLTNTTTDVMTNTITNTSTNTTTNIVANTIINATKNTTTNTMTNTTIN